MIEEISLGPMLLLCGISGVNLGSGSNVWAEVATKAVFHHVLNVFAANRLVVLY